MSDKLKQDDGWQQRTEMLLGKEKTQKLHQAHVLIAGLGGVGGAAAEMLCRAGIGRFTIVDGDIVESTNRNRQMAALMSTVGRKKADVIAERMRDINPEVQLRVIGEYLRDELIGELLDSDHFDCALDAIDTIAPKTYLIQGCLLRQIPLVSCMGSGARLNPEGVQCVDMEKTYNCTLARCIRQRLHKLNIYGGFKAVFSPEPVIASAVVETEKGALDNKRSVTGTISYIPTVFGCHCAAAVVRSLTGE